MADYNDADYAKDVVCVEDDVFERFLPLIHAIANFEPYVAKYWGCHIVDNNWECCRQDRGEKTLYETYSQFSKEYIDEFKDVFMVGLHNPYEEYGGSFHTIALLQNIVTDEIYIDWRDYRKVEERYNDKVRKFMQEWQSIMFSKAKSGQNLYVTQPKYLTEEEKELIKKAENLWRDYQ